MTPVSIISDISQLNDEELEQAGVIIPRDKEDESSQPRIEYEGDPNHDPIKADRLAKQKALLKQHTIPRYRVTGFPDDDAGWAARNAVLYWANRRVFEISLRYRRRRVADIKAAKCIPAHHRPTFYALREMNRLWHRLTLKLELAGHVSAAMAQAMLECPPTGYMVEPRDGKPFRACRHRMCPWCHYRTFLDTLRGMYDNLLTPEGVAVNPDLPLTLKLIVCKYPVREVQDDLGIATPFSLDDLIRRHRRRHKLTDGLACVQCYPDLLFDTETRGFGVCYYHALISQSGPLEPFRGRDDRWYIKFKQRPMDHKPRYAIRRTLTLAFPYPAQYLNAPDSFFFGRMNMPNNTSGMRRLRPFGTWRYWL